MLQWKSLFGYFIFLDGFKKINMYLFGTQMLTFPLGDILHNSSKPQKKGTREKFRKM